MSLVRWISKTTPGPVLATLRPIYTRLQGIRTYLLAKGDSLGIIGPEEIYSENYYEKRTNDPWRSEANSVSNVLYECFEPDSVIDFGCAIGNYLEPLYNKGVTIKGVEGNSAAFTHAVVPVRYLEKYDLRKKYVPDRKYDLALCFEVAEHLPERYSENLIESLSQSSDVVLMTAATPGQGGTHHINEQPHEYWQQKFESRGFKYDQQTTEYLRTQFEVEKSEWIIKNLMAFRSSSEQ